VHGSHLHTDRSGSASELSAARAILLDIEGTTTPIEFVHQVLFPYARARARAYLAAHAADDSVRADIALLRREHAAERPAPPDLPPWDPADDLASAEAFVYWLMDRDRKSTGLKSLQGKIWEAGYRSGELKGKGEVYPDVRPALERWRAAGKRIAIFSSGSVQAQRNLFANTTAGDLSSFLSGYFDTTTGSKRDANSYRRIAAELQRLPEEVLFVSDVSAELDAARGARMQTALCVRGAAPPADNGHAVIHTFAEIF
jgi:enolase-phosphatase E1